MNKGKRNTKMNRIAKKEMGNIKPKRKVVIKIKVN